jgi:hypothetical protein
MEERPNDLANQKIQEQFFSQIEAGLQSCHEEAATLEL